jgi:hypothetical protein
MSPQSRLFLTRRGLGMESPTAKNQKRPEQFVDCVFGLLVARPNIYIFKNFLSKLTKILM